MKVQGLTVRPFIRSALLVQDPVLAQVPVKLSSAKIKSRLSMMTPADEVRASLTATLSGY